MTNSQDKITIGQKINRFRKRAEMSQMELELAIKASPGMISRIENGQVNPTKETLMAIIKTLKLSTTEGSDMFGLLNILPTKEEIEAAKAEVAPYIQRPGFIGYLIDDLANIHLASPAIIGLMNLSEEDVERIMGRNILELVFDPVLKVRQHFDPEFFKDIAITEIARVRAENDFEFMAPETFSRLRKCADFDECWEASTDEIDRVYSAEQKAIYFTSGEHKIKLNFTREPVKRSPGFEVIEFTNPTYY